MLLDFTPNMRMQFDEELRLLRARWERPAPMRDEFRPTVQALLRAAQHTGARRVLLDMADMPNMSVYDQIWLGRHWVPDVVRLPLERVVFGFGARQFYNQLAVEALIKLAQPLIRFDIQFFSESEPALCWLTDDSPRLPELRAEWHGTALPTRLVEAP